MTGLTPTGTILDKIVARKIEEVTLLGDDLKLDQLADQVKRLPAPRDFVAALHRDTIALIAEVKHASPSKGVLIDPFDPVKLGKAYADGGAAAISVLTDQDFFQGSLNDLRAVKAAVPVPVLRKDFIIDERQIAEARLAGADAILLIVAILDAGRLSDLYTAARECGLTPLIEVHTEQEMARALKLAPPLIGINNRDLHTFKVDLNVTKRVAAGVPKSVTLVSESGIFTPADVEFVAEAGAHAILVGESIVKSPDIGAQIRALTSVRVKA